MPPAHRFREIEIKLRVPDIPALKKVLRRLRARQISPRTHERNTLYDTRDQNLRRRGRLIRIRTERTTAGSGSKWPQGGFSAVLTYKAPARLPATPVELRRRLKVREEAEVRVEGAAEIELILRGLGLRPMFRYEKFRTTYLLPSVKDVKLELDETPVGNFLELEGSPSAIDRAARLLGYSPAHYLRATYGALYLADCRRSRRKPDHMVFSNRKKSRSSSLFP